MQCHNITFHQNDDSSKDRYYVDGERVSEDRYDWLIIQARMSGSQYNFATCSRTMANGLTRWTHTQSISIGE